MNDKEFTWGENDWREYFLRLDELRRSRGLKKGELSRLAGVRNLYRKDIDRPGKKSVDRLCREFNVDEAWLLHGEGEGQETAYTFQDNEKKRFVSDMDELLSVREPVGSFNPYGEQTRQTNFLVKEIHALLSEIASGHPGALPDIKIFLEGVRVGIKSGEK